MRTPTEIHIISLGAGVQSSTMSLMAACGEIKPMPTAAIFADTQAEPASVYRWLDWLEKQLPFPVYRVSAGSLEEDTLRIRQRKDKNGFWNPSGIPAFTTGKDGSLGIGPRQCTHDFKIIPIKREQRRLLNEHGANHVISWVGISLDEAHRMKPTGVRYSTNIWPLVERRISRWDCYRWMESKGYPRPAKSACVFCPFHNDAEWRRLRDEEPEAFKHAVEFEKKYQATKRQTTMRGDVWLHSSRKPLDHVDFSTMEERGQISLFGNECEGMCGV